MITLPSPTPLRTSTVMTTAELASWAQVGKNAVPRLVSQFGIREITGNTKNHRFAVHEIMRKIIGVAPKTAEDLQCLLVPLQKATWVARVTGLSVSAINAAACEKRNGFPLPIELSVTMADQAAARGRRWIPSQIEAHLRGEPIPFIMLKAPQKSAQRRASDLQSDAFAAMCAADAELSRQCQL